MLDKTAKRGYKSKLKEHKHSEAWMHKNNNTHRKGNGNISYYQTAEMNSEQRFLAIVKCDQ